jgi:hypothetical protein
MCGWVFGLSKGRYWLRSGVARFIAVNGPEMNVKRKVGSSDNLTLANPCLENRPLTCFAASSMQSRKEPGRPTLR